MHATLKRLVLPLFTHLAGTLGSGTNQEKFHPCHEDDVSYQPASIKNELAS
jgi:hypothetical protein